MSEEIKTIFSYRYFRCGSFAPHNFFESKIYGKGTNQNG